MASQDPWSKRARSWLAREVRFAVYHSGRKDVAVHEGEAALLDLMLARWVHDSGAMSLAEAAIKLSPTNPEAMKRSLSGVAHKLRNKLKLLSAFETLRGLTVDLTDYAYALSVDGFPPSELQGKFPEQAIGIIMSHANDWFVGNMLGGAAQECGDKYSLVVRFSNDEPMLEQDLIRRLAHVTEGLLLVPVSERYDDDVVRTLELNPAVFVDRWVAGVNIPCVRADDREGGRLAAEYLKTRRCKRVFVISQNSRAGTRHRLSPLSERLHGFKTALRGSGETVEVNEAGNDEDGGYKSLENQFAALKKTRANIAADDGVFALTDKLALGCRLYLAQSECPIRPKNVVGYEGQDFGKLLEPPLVSVRLDDFEMGRKGAEVLMSMINAETRLAPNHEKLPVSLIRGEDAHKTESSEGADAGVHSAPA